MALHPFITASQRPSAARPLLARAWALLLIGPLMGSLAHGAAVAGNLQRIEAARERIDEHIVAKDWAGCTALVSEIRDALQSDWSATSLEMWVRSTTCALAPIQSQGTVSAEAVAQAWLPLVAHFSRPAAGPTVVPGSDVRAVHGYWHTLRTYGHLALADRLEMEWVQSRLAEFAAAPSPAAASAAGDALAHLADRYYGARQFTARMEMLHRLYVQHLGPGHLASLGLLRARIFNHRQWSRPAAALALSDEFAVLIAVHHPGNERLAMGNRSERAGALSGVGRYADALDEGRQLLAWLQARTPLPHGNIMRSAYNLAGLAMEMADYTAAERYAQLSVDAGSSAPDLSTRQEAGFPVVLREQARMLRGDPGAAQALRVALEAITSYDLGVSSPLFDLVREGRRLGLADLQAWADKTFSQLIANNTVPMQSTRALPLYLQVQAGTPGDAQTLDKSGTVVAYGLVGRDTTLSVMAHFALARHVAPRSAEGAIWLYKRGAVGLQALRQGLPEEDQGMQKAWLSSYEADLRAFIGLLIDSGRLAEAEQAIDVLREEELAEFRRRSRGPAAARRDGGAALSFTPDERQRNQALEPTQARLKRLATEVDARTDQKATWAERVGNDDSAEQALADAGQVVKALALKPSTPTPREAPRDQSAPPLPPGVARLSYFVRDRAAHVVLQRGAHRQVFRLPQGAAAINREVQALRASLVKPGAGVPAAATTLYQWLMAPLARHLAGTRHLSVAPDGALRYVPFAVLHDGRRYLVQRFSVSVEPLHPARTKPAPRARPQPQLAAFGRTLPDEQHSALPGVAQELAVLERLRGAHALPVLDAQFTPTALKRALQDKPDVVHLATHFVLDAAGEEASYLLLGDGTRLPLSQLRQLPWPGVGLALLSACDSGLALDTGSAAQGRELTGLAATLQAAGARDVMATLWRIDDASTARWMQAFYAPWQRAGTATRFTAQHLARTQRTWLQRHAGTELAHPHHWAAFTWMGQGS